MKKIRLAIMLLTISIFLFACAGNSVMSISGSDGREYSVDRKMATISCEDKVYSYDITSDEIIITFPDGSSYTENLDEEWMGIGGVMSSNDSGESAFDAKDGRRLINILEEAEMIKESGASENRWMVLLLIVVGTLIAVFPRVFWYLNWGWKFKNAEASVAALMAYRVLGGLLVVIGIGLLFI